LASDEEVHTVPVRKLQQILAPEPEAARIARGLLSTSMRAWGLSACQGDAAVVVSELVTNAVMHAKTALRLDICSDEDWLEISVADDSPWPVQQRPHRQDVAADLVMLLETEQHLGQQLDERDVRLDVGVAGTLAGGRGLLLVEALADEWGVTPRGSGKAVWARLALQR
jgi:anti-sigma regulatory factor (Ser/Thr protein kinase)